MVHRENTISLAKNAQYKHEAAKTKAGFKYKAARSDKDGKAKCMITEEKRLS